MPQIIHQKIFVRKERKERKGKPSQPTSDRWDVRILRSQRAFVFFASFAFIADKNCSPNDLSLAPRKAVNTNYQEPRTCSAIP